MSDWPGVELVPKPRGQETAAVRVTLPDGRVIEITGHCDCCGCCSTVGNWVEAEEAT